MPSPRKEPVFSQNTSKTYKNNLRLIPTLSLFFGQQSGLTCLKLRFPGGGEEGQGGGGGGDSPVLAGVLYI